MGDPSGDGAHNLKVVGSNPTPETRKYGVISYLQSAPRGAFCVAITPGSTAEARASGVIGNKAKTGSISQHRRDRPKPAINLAPGCRSAASPDQPFMHRAAFCWRDRRSADKTTLTESGGTVFSALSQFSFQIAFNQPLKTKAGRSRYSVSLRRRSNRVRNSVRLGSISANRLGGNCSPSCYIPDDHIDPRRSALFMARSVLREARDGDRTC